MSLQATSLVLSRQGSGYEIVFENASQQAAVRLPRSLLVRLSREIARALGTPAGMAEEQPPRNI